jgi:stage V sporulation protein S
VVETKATTEANIAVAWTARNSSCRLASVVLPYVRSDGSSALLPGCHNGEVGYEVENTDNPVRHAGGRDTNVQNLKVSSRSVPHSVAGALAGILRERPTCDIQVIGAGALNQAVKAIAIARTYLVEDELDLSCVPEFSEVDIDGEPRTAIRLLVEREEVGTLDIAAMERRAAERAAQRAEAVAARS